MRGTGSRHPDDDEGLLDSDRLDLGIPLDEVGQRQPVPQQANHSLPQGRAGELGQAFVGFDRGHVRGQALTEAVGVVQVVAYPRLVHGFGEHPVDAEFDVFGLGELQNLTLDIGQLGRRQIVEVDVAYVEARRAHATASSTTSLCPPFTVSNIRRIVRNMTPTLDPVETPRQPTSPPTERVVAIMGLLGAQPARAFSLAEISRGLGISRATGHAILSTLASHHWVVRDAAAAYSWGPGIASLAKPAGNRIFHGILQELAESTATQVFLARRDANNLVVVDSAGESASGMRVDRGLRMPLVAPFGRDYIAWSAAPAQRAWLEGIGKPSGALSRRITAVIAEIRARGYAIERLSREYVQVYTALRALGGDGEPDAITARIARAFADLTVIDILRAELTETSTHSIATISAPITDEDGVVSMSISAAPFTDLAAATVEHLGEQVRAGAQRIEAHIALRAAPDTRPIQ
jgi:DNA-binding IclR family transcriptional regulator